MTLGSGPLSARVWMYLPRPLFCAAGCIRCCHFELCHLRAPYWTDMSNQREANLCMESVGANLHRAFHSICANNLCVISVWWTQAAARHTNRHGPHAFRRILRVGGQPWRSEWDLLANMECKIMLWNIFLYALWRMWIHGLSLSVHTLNTAQRHFPRQWPPQHPSVFPVAAVWFRNNNIIITIINIYI